MLILRHLALFNLDLKSSTNGLSNPLISRKFIIEFMKKLAFRTSYMIPAERTATSDRLFEEAFEGTWVLNDYKAAPIKSSETGFNQPVHSDAPEGGA
jgi:hypothetical protein